MTNRTVWPGGCHGALMISVGCLALVWGASASAEPAPPDHEVKLATRDTARVGQTRALSLTITPRPGFSISRDGPLRVDVKVLRRAASGSGSESEQPVPIELSRERYARRDAADARAEAPRFDLGYRARSAGAATVQVSALFWLCGRRVCWPVHETRDVVIEVLDRP